MVGQLRLKKDTLAQIGLDPFGRTDRPGLIVDTSVGDVNNWLIGRARGAYIDASKTGIVAEEEMQAAIVRNLLDGSDSALDSIAAEAARTAVAGGR